MSFNTANKQAIRTVWNRPILASRVKLLKRGLYYFGLSGPEMHDVLDWLDLLQRDVTAVENSKQFFDLKSQMADVAAEHDFNPEVLRGNVEDILISGRSADNEPARRATFVLGQLRLAYDLVNLDYIGGKTLIRQRALESLFRAQADIPFTLFLTYNVRTPMIVKIDEELGNIRTQVEAENERIVEWYERHGQDAVRLKAVVPPIVCSTAAAAHLDCKAYPPVRYIGDGNTTLVHFAFDLTPRQAAFRGHHMGTRALLTLPLVEAKDGALRLSENQDPAFDRARCESDLMFLPESSRKALLKTLP